MTSASGSSEPRTETQREDLPLACRNIAADPCAADRIAAGAVSATQETDGIDLISGSFGPDYPVGLFLAQAGDNRPYAQYVKLVSW